LEAEYPASISRVFNIIPSQEDWHAFSKKLLILCKVVELSIDASSSSTYIVGIDSLELQACTHGKKDEVVSMPTIKILVNHLI
jgi:hypothetical protein